MAVVGIRELANGLSKYIEMVETTGEPLVITRHGKPIAAMQVLDQERLEALVLATAPQFVQDFERADRELAEGKTRSTDEVRAELGLGAADELPLVGEDVVDEAGAKVGEIADVVISGRTGEITHAVMDFADENEEPRMIRVEIKYAKDGTAQMIESGATLEGFADVKQLFMQTFARKRAGRAESKGFVEIAKPALKVTDKGEEIVWRWDEVPKEVQ